MRIIKIILLFIVIIFSLIGIGGFLLLINIPPFSDWSDTIDPTLAANFSTIYQGIFGTLLTFASIIIIAYTIINDKIAKRYDSIENRVIQLCNMFVDSRKAIIVHGQKDADNIGQRAFIFYKIRIRKIIYYVTLRFKELKLDIDKLEEEIIDIAYLVFFFGFGREYSEKIKAFYQTREVKSIDIEDMIKYLEMHHLETCRRTEEGNLGQYFRQLYNIVSLIDSKKYLTQKEKYELVKIVRVQLSNQEQTLLFYNSLSKIGQKWREEGLIEKYKMLKNINDYDLTGIEIKKYYPRIESEIEEKRKKPNNRFNLIKPFVMVFAKRSRKNHANPSQ